MTIQASLQRRWYGRPGWLWLLLPLEFIYRLLSSARRYAYRRGWLSVWRAPVPVLIVGNIAVGGTGKTPVVIALCQALRAAGFRPGIISRGYGAQPPAFPYAVDSSSPAIESGDEPLLLARRSGCPVVIAPDRPHAARYLLQRQRELQAPCDVLISDDGLQHYALARDIELVVIDAARGWGNGHQLPVGPLRESTARLRRVDALLINDAQIQEQQDHRQQRPFDAAVQYRFRLQPTVIVHLASGRECPVEPWFAEQSRVHAVAGIGNPQRFFNTLRQFGCQPIEHAFADHHNFSAADLQFADAAGSQDKLPVLMTEKDATKCAAFAADNHWYLRVEAELPDSLLAQITGKLAAIKPR